MASTRADVQPSRPGWLLEIQAQKKNWIEFHAPDISSVSSSLVSSVVSGMQSMQRVDDLHTADNSDGIRCIRGGQLRAPRVRLLQSCRKSRRGVTFYPSSVEGSLTTVMAEGDRCK